MKSGPESELNKMGSRKFDNNIMTSKCETILNLWSFARLREGQVEKVNNIGLFLYK